MIFELLEGSFSTDELDFLAAIYYMMVTAFTIGYGDIYPLRFLAKMTVSIMVLILLAIIQTNVSKLIDVIK